jgi:PAS domain S-box-containing protein
MLMRPDSRTQQRDFLLEITRAITAQLDLSEVLRRVLHASVVMLAGRVGVIALRDEHDGLFYVRAYTGITSDIVPDLNQKLIELVEGTNDGLSREYLNEKLREMADTIDEELEQSVAMPLVFAQNPLGLLIVFRSYQTTITGDDLTTLQSFADQAAIAVQNAQMYERINQERQRLAAILNNSGDGVFTLNPDMTFQQVNMAFERMTGWSTDEAIGMSKDEVIIWDKLENHDLETAIIAGWPHRHNEQSHIETIYVEGDLVRRDGMALSIGITYAPLLTEDGRLASIIANVRDITNFRKAQEMQSVFISTIHHELRTPIAIIKGYASTLRREDVEWDHSVIRDNSAIIEEEADRLTTLVEDLLTASKIQAEREVKLNLADVRLEPVAARSVERLEGQSKHRIVLSFPDNFPIIQGDEARLRQAIDNLLTNAIKYSPSSKTITVGGRFTDSHITLFVRDEGEGIPSDQIDKIFDRFYRIDDKLTRKTQGTGLGLYLVKAIVEAHQGEISVKSHIGHGSTFYFTLPRD